MPYQIWLRLGRASGSSPHLQVPCCLSNEKDSLRKAELHVCIYGKTPYRERITVLQGQLRPTKHPLHLAPHLHEFLNRLMMVMACSIPDDGLLCGIVLIGPLTTDESAQTAGTHRITIDIPHRRELSRYALGWQSMEWGAMSETLAFTLS